MAETKVRLEDLEFKYANDKGLVKMIKWGEDYKYRSCEDRLEYAEVLASAMNEACDTIQQHRDKVLGLYEKALDDVVNADKAMAISKTTLVQVITNSNAEKQELAKRIQELEARVKIQDQVIRELNEK